jgi:hypothetical protein
MPKVVRPLPYLAAGALLLNACTTARAPRITTFEAFPRTISTPGQRVTLSWTLEADPATIVTLSAQTEGGGDEPTTTEVSGQTLVTVTPTATTLYTLRAQSVGGSDTRALSVALVPETEAPGSGEPR